MKELKKHREVLEEMEKETLTLCKLTGKEHPRVKALRYAIDILGRVDCIEASGIIDTVS